jgi:hypothetical protein
MATGKKRRVIVVSGDEDDKGLIEHFVVVIDERLTEQENKQNKLEDKQTKLKEDFNERIGKCESRVSTLETRIAIYVAISVTVIAMGWQIILKVFK